MADKKKEQATSPTLNKNKTGLGIIHISHLFFLFLFFPFLHFDLFAGLVFQSSRAIVRANSTPNESFYIFFWRARADTPSWLIYELDSERRFALLTAREREKERRGTRPPLC